MDADFRWFEGEKAQYRFVPYGWAFLFVFGAGRANFCRSPGGLNLKLPGHKLRQHADEEAAPDLEVVMGR
jgi:hypothetical protein